MSKKARLVNFNEIYDPNKVVTNYMDITKDKQFTDDGIFSESIFGEFSDDNIESLGWIDFEDYYIINPIMYCHLKKLLGKKFERIIKYNKVLNRDGDISEEIEQAQESYEEDDNLGLKAFKENFFDIIEKWGNKNKYEREYKFIIENYKFVFINKFPLFNAKLRPASIIENTLTKDEINNQMNMVLRYLNEIKDIKEDYIVLPLLFNIQTFCNEIWSTTVNSYLKGKKGWLRRNNLG